MHVKRIISLLVFIDQSEMPTNARKAAFILVGRRQVFDSNEKTGFCLLY